MKETVIGDKGVDASLEEGFGRKAPGGGPQAGTRLPDQLQSVGRGAEEEGACGPGSRERPAGVSQRRLPGQRSPSQPHSQSGPAGGSRLVGLGKSVDFSCPSRGWSRHVTLPGEATSRRSIR